ncbi:MAG: AMP-binding protein, partial [Gaiellales bacterium]
YGAPMLEAYGMTEASHQMASNPLPPGERRVGSVGVATGIEIAIADDAGTLLDAGAVGEVCIRGPGVTTGYLGNPEANESSFFDGWFRTGDQGVLDRAGYLTLTGRIKELILRGGENISPLEVEEVLLAHPLVEDAVAFGIADDKYGEEVGAAVATSHDVSAQEIVDHCRERLSSFKVPKAVHVLEEIPRTATGKVQRRRVAELLHGTG